MNNHIHRAVIFTCGLAIARGQLKFAHAQDERATDPDPQRFANEIRVFSDYDLKTSPPAGATLFVGSSSIRLWPTAQSFPDRAVINRGFGGSHVSDVNFYTDDLVIKYRPKLIVFYAGDNDIADRKSPQQVFEDTRTFVKNVHDKLPDTRIIYLSIKPSVARWQIWPKMLEANSLIRKLADQDDKLDFVDMSPPLFGGNGQPRADLLRADGLHLNEEGYRAWTKHLLPFLSQADGQVAQAK